MAFCLLVLLLLLIILLSPPPRVSFQANGHGTYLILFLLHFLTVTDIAISSLFSLHQLNNSFKVLFGLLVLPCYVLSRFLLCGHCCCIDVVVVVVVVFELWFGIMHSSFAVVFQN